MSRWLAAFLLCAMLLAGQSRRGREGRGASLDRGAAGEQVAAEFKGTVKGSSTKDLLIEVADGNTLAFHITRKTMFYRGAERVKANAVQQGLQVTVEGKKAPDNSLDAVTVRVEKQK